MMAATLTHARTTDHCYVESEHRYVYTDRRMADLSNRQSLLPNRWLTRNTSSTPDAKDPGCYPDPGGIRTTLAVDDLLAHTAHLA